MRVAIITVFAFICALLLTEATPLMERKVKAVKTPKKISVPKKLAAPPAIPKEVATPKKIVTPEKITTANKVEVSQKVVTSKVATTPKKVITSNTTTSPTSKSSATANKFTSSNPSPIKSVVMVPTKASVQVSATASAEATPAIKACPIRRPGATGKKTGTSVKGRADPADDCEVFDPKEFDLKQCAKETDCERCISTGGLTFKGTCAFTAGALCVPGNRVDFGDLLTTSRQCKTLATKKATDESKTADGIIRSRAKEIYKAKIRNHILGLNALGETEKDKSSGRHLLGVWKTANTGSKELKRNVKTGLVVFQIPSSPNIKTVWNDIADEENAGTPVFTEEDVEAVCQVALFHSIKRELNNKAIEGTAEAAKLNKKVAPVTREQLIPFRGKQAFSNGFITKDPKTGIKVCINVSEASCFPFSLDPVNGAEGAQCKGDAKNV